MSRFPNQCRPLASATAALVLFALIGCTGSSRDLDLDQPQAREALESALDAWKLGMTPAELKPEVVVSDWDWKAGKMLIDYEILPEETNDGTNLHIPVELTLKDSNGNESRPRVTYTVGTSPVVTVFRE